MGRRQMVRQRPLEPPFVGSSPTAPASPEPSRDRPSRIPGQHTKGKASTDHASDATIEAKDPEEAVPVDRQNPWTPKRRPGIRSAGASERVSRRGAYGCRVEVAQQAQKGPRAARRMQDLKLFSGNANVALARARSPNTSTSSSAGPRSAPSATASARSRSAENVRGPGLLRAAIDLCSPEYPPDGAADHARRAQARVGPPRHRGDPLLRLRPPGPEGPKPRVPITAKLVADLIHAAGRRSGPVHGPPLRPDPGLLQHPRRQPLLDAAAARPRSSVVSAAT